MKLSVIIPTYNEEDFIADTIRTVQRNSNEHLYEIIVVDGGSSDNTIPKAKETGAGVAVSPQKRRAAQMNFGAELADGNILYFLHADTTPPPNFDQQINRAASSGFKSGCFRLSFDADHPLLDFYAWCTQFNVDAFRFGDQSLYIKKDLFTQIKGFRENHILMEDNEIIRRIKKRSSFLIMDDSVETSSRAYLQIGVVKLQFIFALIFLLYFCGVEQETLGHIKKNAAE